MPTSVSTRPPAAELNHGSTMIKIAEYMGCGRPVVAYDLRETRLTAGLAALYAPCGRADVFAALICDLAGDGERRLELGRRARERALELTWEHSEQALLKVYGRLPGGRVISGDGRREARRPEPQRTSSKAA